MTDLFQYRYYKINKFLLSSIGQWPYQYRPTRRMLLATVLFLAASQIIPQIIAVVEFHDDVDVILESISPFVIDIACGTKLANIVLNSNKMWKLAERMKTDWISVADQPEIQILHEYAEIGRQFTVAWTVVVYGVAILFMTQPVVPQILLALRVTHEIRPKKFPFPVDYYGIDFDTYYYYMLVHSYICVGAIATVIAASDTMFIVYVQHACGIFTVVGRQLERVGEGVNENYEPQSKPSMDPDFQHFARCIKKHNEAIEFANLLEDSYTWSFFSFVGLNMIMMSVTGFQAVVKLDESLEEAIRYGTFTVGQMVHLFFQSFFSQRLMDHSQQVSNSIYQGKWYRTSLCAQKLLNLVTMRTHVPCRLTAGKVMVMSLENFTAIFMSRYSEWSKTSTKVV